MVVEMVNDNRPRVKRQTVSPMEQIVCYNL